MKESLNFDTISIMQVVKAPDPRLRIVTKPVKKITPELLRTTREMIKLTKTFKDPDGVGLASTQVGLDGSFFVALVSNPKKDEPERYASFFNPQILSFSEATREHVEGCLSTLNYWGFVTRSRSVRAIYLDETGRQVTKTLTGLLAHIFQHEVDHLNGVLFQDRVMQQGGKFYKVTGKDEKTGEDIFEEVSL